MPTPYPLPAGPRNSRSVATSADLAPAPDVRDDRRDGSELFMFGDPNDEACEWAKRIARAYAEASSPRLAPDIEGWLQKHLVSPLAQCIILALPPDEWALLQLDPQMDRWEALARQRPGPRIAAVDYGAGTVTMGPWRKSKLRWTET